MYDSRNRVLYTRHTDSQINIARMLRAVPTERHKLAIVDIDASKGFVDLWVHLSYAIFAIFDQKRKLKLLEISMACD